MATNPYAPPSAAVADHNDALGAGEERLIPGGRSCPAGSGWGWFASGWGLFKAKPGMWWLTILIGVGLLIVTSLIPFLNLVTGIFFWALVAGYGSCARRLIHEGTFEIDNMFDGFRVRLGPLIGLGVLYVATIVVALLLLLAMFNATGLFTLFLGGTPDQADAQALAGLGGAFFLAYFGVTFMLIALFAYAPYLIHEHGVGVFEAMGLSFRGCVKNVPAGIVGMVVFFVLSILATLPLFLGWLVLGPVMYLAVYASYRDIFVDSGEAD